VPHFALTPVLTDLDLSHDGYCDLRAELAMDRAHILHYRLDSMGGMLHVGLTYLKENLVMDGPNNVSLPGRQNIVEPHKRQEHKVTRETLDG
jgi:hypothetical protein